MLILSTYTDTNEFEENKICDWQMFQSLQNTANESTYISTNHMSEGSHPKNSSDPSNSPTVFTAGKQAPVNAYKTTIRINITHPEKAQEWLQNMMNHSKCMYYHTKGRAPVLKQVLYMAEMHCQHKAEQLTPQRRMSADYTVSGKKES